MVSFESTKEWKGKMKWRCPAMNKSLQSQPSDEVLAGMSVDDKDLKLKNLVENESRFWKCEHWVSYMSITQANVGKMPVRLMLVIQNICQPNDV